MASKYIPFYGNREEFGEKEIYFHENFLEIAEDYWRANEGSEEMLSFVAKNKLIEEEEWERIIWGWYDPKWGEEYPQKEREKWKGVRVESSEIAGWIVGTPMMGFMVGYFIVWIVKDIKRSRKQRRAVKRWKKRNKGK